MQPPIPKSPFNWRFIILWCLATAFGCAVSFAAIVGLPRLLYLWNPNIDPAPGNLAGMGIAGLALGLVQWLVLRDWMRYVGWWVFAPVVGWVVVGLVSWLLPDSTLLGNLLGSFAAAAALAALIQWFKLRGRVRRAGWWIIGSVASWVLVAAVFDLLELLLARVEFMSFWLVGILLFILLFGGGGGLLTGMVLTLLLFGSEVPEQRPEGWRVFWIWFLVTWLTGLLAGLAAELISSMVYDWRLSPGLFGLVLGAGIGLGQWLLLRPRRFNGWWALASALGCGLGLLLTGSWGGPGPWLVVGTLVGLGQWVLLRQQVQQAGWWILFSAAAWSLAGALYEAIDLEIFAPVLVWSMAALAALTGLGLILLLKTTAADTPAVARSAG